MTTITIYLAFVINFLGKQFTPTFLFSGSLPSESITIPGPDGTAAVLTQSDGGFNVALHLPIFGNVFNHTFPEAVSHSVAATFGPDSVTGSISIGKAD
jgi:hypothetical protein